MLHVEVTSSEDSGGSSQQQQLSFCNIEFADISTRLSTRGRSGDAQTFDVGEATSSDQAGGRKALLKAAGGRQLAAPTSSEIHSMSASVRHTAGCNSKSPNDQPLVAGPKRVADGIANTTASSLASSAAPEPSSQAAVTYTNTPAGDGMSSMHQRVAESAAGRAAPAAASLGATAADRLRQSKMTSFLPHQSASMTSRDAVHSIQPQYVGESPLPLPDLPAWLRGSLSSSNRPSAVALDAGRRWRSNASPAAAAAAEHHAGAASAQNAGLHAVPPALRQSGATGASESAAAAGQHAAQHRFEHQATKQRQGLSSPRQPGAAATRHSSDGATALPRQKSTAKRRAKAGSAPMAMAADGKSLLHHELLQFAAQVAPTAAERDALLTAVRGVRAAAQSIWPQSTATLFGSQATGLALPGADLDVVVMGNHSELDKPGTGFSKEARLAISGLLEDLLDALLQATPPVLKGKAQIISAAKVPIIKCQLAAGGGVPADISIGVGNGIRAVHFINRQLAAIPPLRPLVLAVKTFMRERCLNEVFTGGLSSYSITNMCMALLQQEGIAILAQSAAVAEAVSMSASAASDNEAADLQLVSPDAAAAADLGLLLQRFFMCFGRQFSYGKHAVSVRLGGIVSKLPEWKLKGRLHLLAVEDPQEKAKDIGSGSYNIRKVVDAFRQASERLASACASDAQDSDAAAWARIQADGRSKSVAVQQLPILRNILDTDLAVSREESVQRKRANWAAAKSVKIRKKGKFARAHDCRLQQQVLGGEVVVGRGRQKKRKRKQGQEQDTINSKTLHKKQKPKRKKAQGPSSQAGGAASSSNNSGQKKAKQKASRPKLGPKGGGVTKRGA